MKKHCNTCNITKSARDFRQQKASKDGISSVCKECHKKMTKEYWEKNPGRLAIKKRRWHLKKKYGLTVDDFLKMLKDQNSQCFICKEKSEDSFKGLHVDHDHATGKVRSLLCRACNIALGLIKDSPARAVGLASYLEMHNGK